MKLIMFSEIDTLVSVVIAPNSVTVVTQVNYGTHDLKSQYVYIV